MKIFYVMQQSIYDNNGNWISADSNINMYAGIVEELLERTDWEFYVLIGTPFKDIDSPDEILESDRIHYIDNDYPVSSVLSRYHFDMHKMKDLISDIQPDVIWNNMPSITRNFQALIDKLNLDTKVINCNYWIDAPNIGEGKIDDEKVEYAMRQIDGAIASDLLPFTCESTREIFMKEINQTLNQNYEDKLRDKSTIWDFGFSIKELEEYRTDESFDKITVLFANRLSGINYTHHLEFIEAVNKLYEYRKDFQVIFTNPSQKVSWDKLIKDVDPLKVISEDALSREEYVKLLWKSDIIVNLFDKERYGGCANTEGIYCDCIPVMNYYGEYKTRATEDYPYFIDLPLTVDKLRKRINGAINLIKGNDNPLEIKKKWKLRKKTMKSSYEFISKRVIKDINSITGGEINDN